MNLEIAQYAAAVGAALADLPESTRNELLEDLPEHLAEVAAEVEASPEGGTLLERLGPPAAYAAELRATLGQEAPARRRRFPTRAQVLARLRPMDANLGRITGYPRFSDLLRQLRPAWWVLRGYLAALIIGGLLGSSIRASSVVPVFGGNPLLGLFLIGGCVVGSLWLGHAAVRGALRFRITSAVASVILAVFTVAAIATVDTALGRYDSGNVPQTYYYMDNAASYGNDVVVVDQKGHPIGPVGIVDLNSGNYLDMSVHTCENMMPWDGGRWPLLAELCKTAPTTPGSGTPSPSPPSPLPSPTS